MQMIGHKKLHRNLIKRFVHKTVALLLGLAMAITLSEALLRTLGYRPWTYRSTDANEPTMHEPDSILGWRNKTGSYIVPPYDPSGEPIQITFVDNGRRVTGPELNVQSGGQFVVLGDSFTQGWAISDRDTYAWKLRQRLPFLEVLNYGTAGYSSYQCLLVLERELPVLTHPKFVLYGFTDSQEARSVAPGWWLRQLTEFSKRGHVDVPFASLDGNKRLIGHAPERYLSLPLRDSLASIALIERAYMEVKTKSRFLQRRSVTEQILLQMNRVSKEHNASFAVVWLSVNPRMREHYVNFLGDYGIQCIDCDYTITDEMRVPGEGHPNGTMNTLWAECILKALSEQRGNGGPLIGMRCGNR